MPDIDVLPDALAERVAARDIQARNRAAVEATIDDLQREADARGEALKRLDEVVEAEVEGVIVDELEEMSALFLKRLTVMRDTARELSATTALRVKTSVGASPTRAIGRPSLAR